MEQKRINRIDCDDSKMYKCGNCCANLCVCCIVYSMKVIISIMILCILLWSLNMIQKVTFPDL